MQPPHYSTFMFKACRLLQKFNFGTSVCAFLVISITKVQGNLLYNKMGLLMLGGHSIVQMLKDL